MICKHFFYIYCTIIIGKHPHFSTWQCLDQQSCQNWLIILTYCLKIRIFYHTKILRYPKIIIIIVIITMIKKKRKKKKKKKIVNTISTITKENSKNQSVSEAIPFLQREIISEVVFVIII